MCYYWGTARIEKYNIWRIKTVRRKKKKEKWCVFEKEMVSKKEYGNFVSVKGAEKR